MYFLKRLLALFLRIIGGIFIFIGFYGVINSLFILPNTPVPIFEEGTDAFELQKWELYGEVYTSSVFFLLSLFISPRCFIVARKLSRKQNKNKELRYNEPFILYLRSFIDDNKGQKFVDPVLSETKTEEENLISVLSEVAPVYCIGSPEEKYTPFGAQRIYVAEHQWKEKVIEMAKYAKSVVLRLGETNNFWWEVEMCLKTIDKDKLLFIIPFTNNFSSIGILYKFLSDNGYPIDNYNISVDRAFKGSISSFVYFNSKGNLESKKLGKSKWISFVLSYENMIRNALLDFMKRYGLIYQKKTALKKYVLIQYAVVFTTIIYILFYSKALVFNLQHGF